MWNYTAKTYDQKGNSQQTQKEIPKRGGGHLLKNEQKTTANIILNVFVLI